MHTHGGSTIGRNQANTDDKIIRYQACIHPEKSVQLYQPWEKKEEQTRTVLINTEYRQTQTILYV